MSTSIVDNVCLPVSSAYSVRPPFSVTNGVRGVLEAYGKLGVADPDAVITALFANGEQGARYDPSDLSTMFQDSAGLTPVTGVGQPVGLILDKSGNDNHASQATAAKRPLLQNDGVNNYLAFDGVDDGLSTASIDFTSTDKMSVFSGVRKTVDASYPVIVESSTNSDANNGSFLVVSSRSAGFPDYYVQSRGTAYGSTVTAEFASPDRAVVSGLMSITPPSVIARHNGVAGAEVTTSQGTGNYSTYPLYIGARAGVSAYFTGNLYSLIVLGRLATAQEITDTETWVNSKTGAY